MRIPVKTVADLKKVIEQFPDSTPIEPEGIEALCCCLAFEHDSKRGTIYAGLGKLSDFEEE